MCNPEREAWLLALGRGERPRQRHRGGGRRRRRVRVSWGRAPSSFPTTPGQRAMSAPVRRPGREAPLHLRRRPRPRRRDDRDRQGRDTTSADVQPVQRNPRARLPRGLVRAVHPIGTRYIDHGVRNGTRASSVTVTLACGVQSGRLPRSSTISRIRKPATRGRCSAQIPTQCEICLVSSGQSLPIQWTTPARGP